MKELEYMEIGEEYQKELYGDAPAGGTYVRVELIAEVFKIIGGV